MIEGNRVAGLTLEGGETVTADVVFSSAGYPETMRLCSDGDSNPCPEATGRISFVESIAVLDELPERLGHGATIVFFNDKETFTYAVPDALVDLRSGVLCCPNNYVGHEEMPEGIIRLTWLANPGRWESLNDDSYAASKRVLREKFVERISDSIPGLREHIVYTDMFTPRTIRRYTGRQNGAVYGSPTKRRDGRTRFENLYICGTDQGFLGIIGAMLSGITMANLHVLSKL